jgi:very-short-patch-repair endonuclease
MGRGTKGILGAKNVEDVLGTAAIKELLSRDHGVIAREELLVAGASAEDIRAARRARVLVQVFPGVFAVAPMKLEFRGYLRGACKWIPKGVVSHRAAGVLHSLDGVGASPVELTTLNHYRARRGIRIRRTRDLPATDITQEDGFQVTTVARTLIDLAAVLSEENLAYAVESAWRKSLITLPELRERLEARRASGLDGAAALDAVLRDCESRPRFFDSGAEVRFWRMLRRARLPTPEIQVEVENGRMRLDFLFRSASLIVETGGGGTKGTPAAYNKDARRSAHLVSAGYRVMPISWEMLKKDPKSVIEQVRSALKHAGARLRYRRGDSASAASPSGERVRSA